MYESEAQLTATDNTHNYRENRTTGGLVAFLLTAPAIVAFMAAPSVVFGVVLGVLGFTLGRRVVSRVRRRQAGGGLSPPEPSSRPA